MRARAPRVIINELLHRLYSLIQLAGDLHVVVALDAQFLLLAGVLPQLKGLGVVLVGPRGLKLIGVIDAQSVVGPGEIRIELDGSEVIRHRRRSTLLVPGFYTKAIGLQGFQRGSRGLRQRNIQLLHRRQRFAQIAAQFGCAVSESIEDFFFGCRGDLLFSQRIAGLAIHSFQSQHVLAAQARNRSGDVGFASGALADFARHVRREFRILRAGHQLQRRGDFTIGKHV